MIETNRMRLYIVTGDMLDALSSGQDYKGIKGLEGWPPKIIKKLIKEDLRKYKKYPELAIWGTYVAVLKETGEIIGDVGYKGPPDYVGEVEIGYGINENHRRKGLGFEAAKGLLDFALSQKDVSAVIAECKVDNAISEKILNALGMSLYDEDRKYKYYRIDKK